MVSDSLMAISNIKKGYNSMSKFSSLVNYNLDLSLIFDGCNFSHTNRVTNGCAHNLARYALEYNDYSFWVDTLPYLCCNPNVTH